MEWNDGLKVKPIRDGGVFVLASPAADSDGVEVKLGTYKDKEGWLSGGQLTPVVYFSEVTDLPADAATKAKVLKEALQYEAVKKAMPADVITVGEMPPILADEQITEDPEPDLSD